MLNKLISPNHKLGVSKGIIILAIILVFMNIVDIVLWGRINLVQSEVINLQEQINESQIANQKVLDELLKLEEHQKKMYELQKQEKERREKEEKEHAINVSYIKNNAYTISSDLSNKGMKMTSKDMNRIIDYWIFHMGVSSTFKNKGDAFIQASKASGLNPIYILAHAACESGWGNSYMAKNRYNYFGINCVDKNPNLGYSMGNSVESGIINGAIWIANNFYKNGYTTLADMKKGNYATDPHWMYNIVTIMNSSRKAL